MRKHTRIWVMVICILLFVCIFYSISFAATAPYYNTGDWSNGPEWWSQGQSTNWVIRKWGCLVVAQSKMLAKAGIASSDTTVFNPEKYCYWEVARNLIDDPATGNLNTKDYAGPQYFAQEAGKSLVYEGIVTSNFENKIWENIRADKYSIVRVYTSGKTGSHYILVNNGASVNLGRLRFYESWNHETGNTTPGTMDLQSGFSYREVLTYSVPVSNRAPRGAFDEASGGKGTVHVRGWAIDDDSSSQSIDVHVYVGGPAGSGAPCYPLTANVFRSDLNGNYGFDATIDVAVTGEKTIYVYGIDTSGGHNPLLGSKTVTIQEPVFTISYDANGGSGAPAVQTFTGNTTISSGKPTREGYTFLGWASSKTAQSVEFAAGASYNGRADLTLYAVWSPNKYMVSFNANGGIVESASKKVTYGGLYGTLPVPTREGYLFNGWYTSTSGGSIIISDSRVRITADQTLYAHWTRITKLVLPSALIRIEDEAYYGDASFMAVTIPDNCAYIGNKAFANCSGMIRAYFPDSDDLVIRPDAFSGCPNVTFYVYDRSSAHTYAQNHNIPFVVYTSDWVLAENVPAGAVISDQKWTYTKRTTDIRTSYNTSMAGYTQTGFEWKEQSSGEQQYASYPSGFDTSHPLYSKYSKTTYVEDESETKKREVSQSRLTFIYYHWSYSRGYLPGDNYNVYVNPTKGNSSEGYYCQYFAALELADELPPSGNVIKYWRNNPDDGSWWWYRFPVYNQRYTDYQKLFTYEKITEEEKESYTQVTESDSVINVCHWVKYHY